MKGVYYNEIDPYAAQWLRNLIEAGHLPHGDVDERSITDVQTDDLRGYVQCHFFAGIGGWPWALRLAGWPDDRPIWTGSCPCQPFSAAGKQQGVADKRHLWPELLRLIAEWDVPTIAGEQVASRLGRDWLAGVRADLEALGYAVGAADISAAGVGAPHIRQRLYWMAQSSEGRCAQLGAPRLHGDRKPRNDLAGRSTADGLGDASSTRGGRDARAVPGAQEEGDRQRGEPRHVADQPVTAGAADRLGDDIGAGLEGRDPRTVGRQREAAQRTGSLSGAWSDFDIVHCTDGKTRRFEPGSFPLAHGVSNCVGRLRAYGNAIVPACAATFIRAFLDIQAHQRA